MKTKYIDLGLRRKVEVFLKTKDKETADLEKLVKQISQLLVSKLTSLETNNIRDKVLPFVSVVSGEIIKDILGDDSDMKALEASSVTKKMFEYSALLGFVLAEILNKQELAIETEEEMMSEQEARAIENANIASLAILSAELMGVSKEAVIEELLSKNIISKEEAQALKGETKDERDGNN